MCTTSSSGEGVSDEEVWAPMPVRGVLSKWTNLLHGWQERYFVLSDGTLTYYRNEDETNLGSRGSVRIRTAFVKPHEYDDCRFEVRVGELIWYLRGVNVAQRQSWIAAIERHRVAESGYGSERTLHRPNSLHSLNSTHSPSIASASSFKRGHGLREKLAEMETFKEILCKQVDSLQAYFDACNAVVAHQHSIDDRLEDWLKDGELTNLDELDWLEDRGDSVRGQIPTTYSYSSDAPHTDFVADSNQRYHQQQPFLDLVDSADDHWKQKAEVETMPLNNSISTTVLPPHSTRSEVSVAVQGDKTGTPSTTAVETQSTKSAGSSGGFLSRFLPSFRSSNTAISTKHCSDTTRDVKPEAQHFRSLSRVSDLRRILKHHGAHALDFRGESHMFKATTVGILTNLAHTIEMMQQHEEQWRRRLEREVEKRRRMEETQRAMAQEMAQLRQLLGLRSVTQLQSQTIGTTLRGGHHTRLQSCGQLDLHRLQSTVDFPSDRRPQRTPDNRALFNLVGPDFEEGPNSPIREEEFYDAIDAESDKIEQDAARLAALRSVGKLLRSAQAMPPTHPLHADLEQVVADRIRNFANPQAFQPPISRNTSDLSTFQAGIVANTAVDAHTAGGDWQVLTQEGEMIIYKREVETEDGVVLDPLQAVHVVHGVTAREMCTYFWDVQYRMDWEFTVDQAPTVLEVCGDDTVVLHQVYKRVWPTTQRDSLFWSHIRQVNGHSDPSNGPLHRPSFLAADEHSQNVSKPPTAPDTNVALDSWMVVNMSTNYLADKVTCTSTPMIRLGLDVVLYCQTVVDAELAQSVVPTGHATIIPRDQLRTRLVYVANINPGGWVPAAGLRTLARREYPRFLRRFSAYVQEQTRDKIPLF
ncbi:collagen type IV alpha-3-binding protein [Paragonimus westermani]|uniref:Collagen type IV alpha-3-binding protein n=1 Tax=Paragonimus westermani TaxID=34504 RepID=A0A5J4NLI0_9TREM|nr:collagen type IV alpha-3-binding protein [Paragonimus westermani]